ncbi:MULTISPECIES: ABC transporter permease [Archaeoglobus]|jgi:NitT/TauT family transport system permease protein|uniref:Nitrate ABC transporter, permease protein (NrtB-1) n=3 Tax=Archaeoglobus fulgidus TaxID=2234 RepID=O30150_ARCFU|nr:MULTISPECIES: ABC transporter permease [Archaeoglobus]AAB91143.1 nitrate ABC transporter, permease protein (nrtB-1) [Archaeoglobus fulgidus DSM 4304]AIG96926.1 ABC-type nitrate/sulfonate/bicarbonate transport system, permease component [Archaeoglobus fulgidus DSM 8774]KUJ94629.1 MAG: Nitrate ABC transporter, permease protein (NrtB-1) [Archaeoglobus fulgidus]KUK07466.1 MAG: Nitrate ABC transporter, permease protein (NrtB-1) [Archaeoglobus fulgidus]MDI3497110.1 NitT/TauT family transport syst
MQASKADYKGYLITLASLLLIWAAASYLLQNPALPNPLDVLALILTRKELITHTAVSLIRVVYSLALALSVALPAGILSRERVVDATISPIIYLLYPIPHIVLLPLYILLFGIGDLSRVLLIATILFFQIAVTTRDAAKQVSDYYVYSILSLGASKIDIYRHVIIPAVMPKILTALRISIGTAIAVLFFAESFATTSGLGYLIIDSWSRADYTTMYAAITTMALLGFALYVIVESAERRVCRWL